ncbi:PREDICTED: CASP-like protein 1F2 isoform X2 [Erythranthe guttata]|uniref:CASP-like protein 1F2 isoform X2 n=1 Tax=Erythranthe guttata TaxID=4155 RepID=UPI00064E002A|nr:PREDICTED: CASP-like protein 1F2 isoform X2 [Erythranthe guttata]|eukprot:XP_012842761.1 PREDICTED: CASP-like protein 1F2 isoform X2 [Erythranthe guttata]
MEKPHTIRILKTHKSFILTQISLRFLAAASTLAATWITFTSKQTTLVFGIQIDARYSYSPTFKFFAYANLIASAFTFLSLFFVFVLGNKPAIMTVLLMGGCAAATAIGYVGKYGNSHSGWVAICGYFGKFCNRITAASLLSYFGFLLYLLLTVISANKSRQIQV